LGRDLAGIAGAGKVFPARHHSDHRGVSSPHLRQLARGAFADGAGLRRLAAFPLRHNGIELELLRAAARDWVSALGDERDLGAEKVPRIFLVQAD